MNSARQPQIYSHTLKADSQSREQKQPSFNLQMQKARQIYQKSQMEKNMYQIQQLKLLKQEPKKKRKSSLLIQHSERSGIDQIMERKLGKDHPILPSTTAEGFRVKNKPKDGILLNYSQRSSTLEDQFPRRMSEQKQQMLQNQISQLVQNSEIWSNFKGKRNQKIKILISKYCSVAREEFQIYEKAIQQLFADKYRLNKEIEKKQSEIDSLKYQAKLRKIKQLKKREKMEDSQLNHFNCNSLIHEQHNGSSILKSEGNSPVKELKEIEHNEETRELKKIQQLELKIADLQQKIEEERDEYQRSLKQKNSETTQLQQQMQELQDQLQRQKKQTSRIEKQVAKMNEQASRKQQSSSKKQEDIFRKQEVSKKQEEAMKKQILQIKAKATEDIAEKDLVIKSLQGQITKLKKQVQVLLKATEQSGPGSNNPINQNKILPENQQLSKQLSQKFQQKVSQYQLKIIALQKQNEVLTANYQQLISNSSNQNQAKEYGLQKYIDIIECLRNQKTQLKECLRSQKEKLMNTVKELEIQIQQTGISRQNQAKNIVSIPISTNISPENELKDIISYRMKVHHYTYQQLRQDILNSAKKGLKAKAIFTLLQEAPFYLNNCQASTLLLSCFQQGQLNLFDCIQAAKVTEMLKMFVSDLKIQKIEEENAMLKKISEVITINRQKINSHLKACGINQSTPISRRQLQLVLQSYFSKQEIDLILSNASMMSQSLEHINHLELFDVFTLKTPAANSSESKPLKPSALKA